MIRSLIAACLSRRPMVLIAYVAFLVLGLAAFALLTRKACLGATTQAAKSLPPPRRELILARPRAARREGRGSTVRRQRLRGLDGRRGVGLGHGGAIVR